ncbi:MAG: type VI secretion system protein TssA [Planctomycetia bacterium]|nr:type VI secretion system protein TssA [Planctomycetia bacterium]
MGGFALDLDLFRAPVSPDAPAGVDLQADETGRARRSTVRDLREEARRIERQADEGDATAGGWPAATGIWRQVRDDAVDILAHVSRDTSIAAMLIEALSRTDGFAGLTTGFDAVRAMVETHEDGPITDEMRLEERSMPLVRLSGLDSEGLLVPAILRIPLTSDRSGEPLCLCHYKSSRDLANETDGEKIQLAVSRGATSPEQFTAAVRSTDTEFFRTLFSSLQAARASWEALSEAVDKASAGAAGLPAGPLRSLFEECDAAIRVFAPQAVPQDPAAGGATEVAPDGAPAAGPAAFAAGDPVGDREAAFRQLEQIAGFFARNDPHSLIAFQLRNIVRLGRMAPAEYYREVIPDGAALQAMFKFVGIQQPADGGGN